MNVTRSNKVERHADMLGTERTREPHLGSGQDSKHLQKHCSLRNPEDRTSPRDIARDSIRRLT